MKTTLKIIGLCCVALIVIIGVYLSIPAKIFDFRVVVTKIEIEEYTYIFHTESDISTSYIIIADNKTKIERCHKYDPQKALQDIKVGDVIEGDYKKWFSEENHAKYIIVKCK